jgi:hypothetical protein
MNRIRKKKSKLSLMTLLQTLVVWVRLTKAS